MKNLKGYSLFANGSLLSSIPHEDVIGERKLPAAKRKKQAFYSSINLFLLLLFLFVVGGCNSASKGESEIMRGIRETNHLFHTSDLIQTSYFFYPSTMRMVNVDNMPNWNEAIKEVRRLSVLSMWPDRFDDAKQKEVIEGLETKEGFSIYAEMDDKYSDFKLLGRENGSEAVLIYNDSTVNYVIHLLGKVNYVKLMKLSTDLREAETTGTGLSFLKKAMGQDADRANRRRRYSDRRREIEAEEQLKKDSIEAARAMETEITE